MKIQKRTAILLAILLSLVACLAIAIYFFVPRPTPPKPLPPGRPLWPSAGMTPVVGFYASSGMPREQIPPTRSLGDPLTGNQSMGADCITLLGSGGDVGYTAGVWENKNAYNWSIPDQCLKDVAAQTITLASGVVVKQPLMMFWPPSYMDYGARWTANAGSHSAPGTVDNPIGRLHLPPWMNSATYINTYQAVTNEPAAVRKWYQSPKFNGEFKTAMLKIIADGGARYTNNPQLVAIRVNVGLSGETMPCCSENCGTPDSFAAIAAGEQQKVSCNDYLRYIKDLVEATYTAFPHQIVLLQSCTAACVEN